MKRLLELLRLRRAKKEMTPTSPNPKTTPKKKKTSISLELFKDDGDLGYC